MSDIFCDPIGCSPPDSLTEEFPRQEYWSGLSFPPPGDLPNPRIKPASPALAGSFFTTEPPEKPRERLVSQAGMRTGQ